MWGILFTAAGFLCVTACGGGQGNQQPPPPPPPTLNLSTLVPDHVIAGGAGTTIFVDGSGFTGSSTVEWNGAPLTTTFGTNQILTAVIDSALIARPGTAQISVKDNSANSNSLPFGIASPAAATAGVISLITVATDGSPANDDSLVLPSISATGRFVAFQSAATNLGTGPASGFQEIYERDTCIGAPPGCTPSTILISSTYNGSPANGHSYNSAISADGRYVTFDTAASNILPNSGICGQSPGSACVFLRDTCINAAPGCTASTSVVTIAMDGTTSGGSMPSISPDGRYVTFYSVSTNIVPGDSNGVGDMFLRDTCHGASSGCTPNTTLVPLSSSGSQANALSFSASVNGTGRYVAFRSFADNLVPNDTNGNGDYFLRDTCIGASGSCTPNTLRVDVSNNGTQTNGPAFDVSPSISSDGRLVGFSSNATNLIAQNVQGWGQVYVRDTCTGAPTGCTANTSLVSIGNDGSIPNSPSDSEVMTSDGRFFVFASLASNLVPGDTFPSGSFRDVFVHDTCYSASSGCTPSTVRVSITNTPNPETPGDSSSSSPTISADGHYVVFLSAATNLAAGITGNGHSMVYLAKSGF
jgi:trimeric autotransporter adhesin